MRLGAVVGIAAVAAVISVDALAASCVDVYKLTSTRSTLQSRRESLQNDFLQALQLRTLVPTKTVTLALGQHQGILSKEQSRLILHLVLKIKKQGYTVVYDADSNAAPLIAEAAGNQGIGISGVPGHENNGAQKVVVIENTSLRMDAFLFRYNDIFQAGHRMIVGLDSVVGSGLLLQNHPHMAILDPSRLWQNQLQRWVQTLGQKAKDLHLAEPPTPEHMIGVNDISHWNLEKVTRESNLQLDSSKKFATATADEKQLVARYAEDILSGEQKQITSYRGAVVFCSAVGDPQSNGVLVRLASILAEMKIPVTTGGSIATMELVNQAAKNAGGVSIGIPIRRPPGHIEFVVPEHAHTLTQLVDAHPARLHFLLEGRDLIFIGPGGKGIIKEIGATFIKLAIQKGPAKFPKIVLIDNYYQGLTAFIKSLPLPQSLKDTIVLLPLDQVNSETIAGLIREGR